MLSVSLFHTRGSIQEMDLLDHTMIFIYYIHYTVHYTLYLIICIFIYIMYIYLYNVYLFL